MSSEQKTEEQKKISPNVSLAIAVVIGLIIGFIIGTMSAGKLAGERNSVSVGSPDILAGGSLSTTTPLSGWITVPDQKAGNYVNITKLNLDKTYWVAVRDNRDTVKEPYVLGARKLLKGDNSNVDIYVSRPTIAGQSYDIVFYNDSPTFNYDSKNLVMDGSDILRVTFKAQQ